MAAEAQANTGIYLLPLVADTAHANIEGAEVEHEGADFSESSDVEHEVADLSDISEVEHEGAEVSMEEVLRAQIAMRRVQMAMRHDALALRQAILQEVKSLRQQVLTLRQEVLSLRHQAQALVPAPDSTRWQGVTRAQRKRSRAAATEAAGPTDVHLRA